MGGLDNYIWESFPLADALQKLVSAPDFGLGNESWTVNHSHLFRIVYYRNIFNSVQFRLVHLTLYVELDFEPVCLADMDSCQIIREVSSVDCWWNIPYQLSLGASIVPVNCLSNKTYRTNYLRNQHARPLYLIIGDIQEHICWILTKYTRILVGLISCPPKGYKNMNNTWYNTVQTGLSLLMNLDRAGPSLHWYCTDGFQRQSDSL